MARIGEFFLLCLLLPCLSYGYRAEAQLSTDHVQVGDVFPLLVQAHVDGSSANLPSPQVRLPAGIRQNGMSRSESRSSSVQIINFHVKKSVTTIVTWQIDLQAVRNGTWTVGPVMLGRQNLGAARITVGNGSGGGSAASLPAGSGGGSAHGGVGAMTIVPKRNAYVGEQIPFTWRLEATRPFQVNSFPDMRSILGSGFWTAAPDTEPRLQIIAYAGGRKGRLDMPGSLFPLRAGNFRLPVTSLNYQIVEQEAVDPFEALMAGQDPFAAGRTRTVNGTARTQAVPLTVRDLPTSGKPASFQGGVGTFTLQARLEKPEVHAGEGVNLILRLTGDGQPQGSGAPLWDAPKGIEAYPPEDRWTKVWKSGRLWSTLERHIVLVPDAAGKVELPPVRFGYFDPERGEYRELTVPLSDLRVLPALNREGRPTAGSGAAALTRADRFWVAFGKVSAVLWALLLLTGIATGIFLLVRRYGSIASRRRRAFANLRKALPVIARGNDARSRASRLRAVLTETLSWELGERSRGFTLQETLTALNAWTEPERQQLADFWKALDAAEFAGIEPPDASWLETLLRRLESR